MDKYILNIPSETLKRIKSKLLDNNTVQYINEEYQLSFSKQPEGLEIKIYKIDGIAVTGTISILKIEDSMSWFEHDKPIKKRTFIAGYMIIDNNTIDIVFDKLLTIINHYGLQYIVDEKYFYKNYDAFVKVNSIYFSKRSFDKWKRKNGYLIIDRRELLDNEYLNHYSPGGDASRWSNNELEINVLLDREENKISLEVDFFDKRGKCINDLKILKVFNKSDGENYKTYLEDKLNIKFK